MTFPVGKSPLSFSDQLTYVIDDDSGEVPFCTKDNVADCLSYLNQELLSIGVSSICTADTADSCHITSLVNTTYSLLQRFRRCVKSRDELLESKYRAESDLEHVQQDRKRLNSVMRQQERDLMQTQLREKQLSRTNKIVMGKLKTEKDEVRRLLVVIQNRDAQYKHAVRKKESELAKLKERLHDLLINSKAETKLYSGSLEMSDLLMRTDGKRGRWKMSSNNVEELMYRSVISGHEEKHKQLVVENHELREILTYLLTELTMLTHGCCQSQAVDHDDDDDELDKVKSLSSEVNTNGTFIVNGADDVSCDSTTRLTAGQMSLPLTMIETDIKKELRQKITQLRSYIHTLETSSTGSCAGRSDNTRQDAVEVRRLEDHQWLNENKELNTSVKLTSADADDKMTVMTASELLQQTQQLNNDRRLFYEEMVEFEERKRQLADLECQLNKQRIAVEMDRCNEAVMSCRSSFSHNHRPRSAVTLSAASRRLIQDTQDSVTDSQLIEQLVSNGDSDLQQSSSSSRSLSCGRTANQRHFDTSVPLPTVMSCCFVDTCCHNNVPTSSLVSSSPDVGNTDLTS